MKSPLELNVRNNLLTRVYEYYDTYKKEWRSFEPFFAFKNNCGYLLICLRKNLPEFNKCRLWGNYVGVPDSFLLTAEEKDNSYDYFKNLNGALSISDS